MYNKTTATIIARRLYNYVNVWVEIVSFFSYTFFFSSCTCQLHSFKSNSNLIALFSSIIANSLANPVDMSFTMRKKTLAHEWTVCVDFFMCINKYCKTTLFVFLTSRKDILAWRFATFSPMLMNLSVL